MHFLFFLFMLTYAAFMCINPNGNCAYMISFSLVFYLLLIRRRVPETQCKFAAPEIGEGGQDILAVRQEYDDGQDTICCNIDDIIAATCDDGYK